MNNLEQVFTIREVSPDERDLLREIFKLRVKCREASGYITFEKFPDGWYDEEDYVAKHFVVYDDAELIASGRVNIYGSIYEVPCYPAFPPLTIEAGKIGFLYRNGVLPQYRNKGISKTMNEVREVYMKDNGCRYSMGYCRDFQVDNFLKHSYENRGVMDTGKVKWDLPADNWHLMVKEL